MDEKRARKLRVAKLEEKRKLTDDEVREFLELLDEESANASSGSEGDLSDEEVAELEIEDDESEDEIAHLNYPSHDRADFLDLSIPDFSCSTSTPVCRSRPTAPLQWLRTSSLSPIHPEVYLSQMRNDSPNNVQRMQMNMLKMLTKSMNALRAAFYILFIFTYTPYFILLVYLKLEMANGSTFQARPLNFFSPRTFITQACKLEAQPHINEKTCAIRYIRWQDRKQDFSRGGFVAN